MTASRDTILATIRAYVDYVGTGTADQILSLFADGATVEDPIGTPVRTTRESIHEFYAAIEGLDQTTTLGLARVAAGQAAFSFEIATRVEGATYLLTAIDVMTFDDDGRITSMRAFYGDDDLTVA